MSAEQSVPVTLSFLATDLQQVREQAQNPDLDPDEMGWLIYMADHAEVVTPPPPGEPAGPGSEVSYTFNGEPRTTVIGSYYLPERTTALRASLTSPLAAFLVGTKPGDRLPVTIAKRKAVIVILDVRPYGGVIDYPAAGQV